jgi:predicted GIY-YIG superfamily endonuclease
LGKGCGGWFGGWASEFSVIVKMPILFQIQKSTVILSAAKDLQFCPGHVIRGFRCWGHYGKTAMREQKFYYVYIVASRSRTLYIGITSKPEQRAVQHKTHSLPGFRINTAANALYSSSAMQIHKQPLLGRSSSKAGYVRVRSL